MRITSWFLMLMLAFGNAYAQDTQQDFDSQVQKIFLAHFNEYKNQEYFSGASLSIYVPDQKIKNYYLGRSAHDSKSAMISANTLFQIGSITKSFTAAIVLQLEKTGKLSLNNSIRDWLPQYKKWSAIHINQLLNMTSALPNYTDTPLFNAQVYYNLSRQWKDVDLINYVYPVEFFPPLKTGFFYSNTNYILAGLIIEKAAANTFQHELLTRMIQPADLKNTFYKTNMLDSKLHQRLAHGYNFNQYDNPGLVGKDIYENNLSWAAAAAAGGIISTSEDIIKWVQALFINNKILDNPAKAKMMNLVSQKNGNLITQTSPTDPQGFGLGVAQAFDPSNGQFWYYEGKTLGFRAVYWYKPCNRIIISAIFNSATDEANDHVGKLLKQLYPLILNQYPQLKCR